MVTMENEELEKCNGELVKIPPPDGKESNSVWVACKECTSRAGYDLEYLPERCAVLKGKLYTPRNKDCKDCKGDYRGILLFTGYSPCNPCAIEARATKKRANSTKDIHNMVRHAFNSIATGVRKSPREILELTIDMFPDENLSRASFGTVFSDLEYNDEINFIGIGRAREYWRNKDLKLTP